MHESSLAQEFVREGEQIGILIGIRQSILVVLALRFGEEENKELTEPLERITDRDRLFELHKLAVKALRLSQFRRAIAGC